MDLEKTREKNNSALCFLSEEVTAQACPGK